MGGSPSFEDTRVMDRRTLIASSIATLASAGCATAQPRDPAGSPPPPNSTPSYPAQPAEPYSREELVNTVSDFLGVTAEAAGGAIERVFQDNGRPTAYIAGEEAAGAITIRPGPPPGPASVCGWAPMSAISVSAAPGGCCPSRTAYSSSRLAPTRWVAVS